MLYIFSISFLSIPFSDKILGLCLVNWAVFYILLPHGKTFADAIMNRTRSKHSAVDGQTLPKRRPQTKDGQAPVPRVIVFPIMSLLKSELVDSLSPIGRPACCNLPRNAC